MTITLILGTPYIKSLGGVLKLVQLVASLIGVVIIAISGSSARGVAFTVAGVGSIIVSCVFILIYVTHLAGKFPRQLVQVELHFAWLWSIFFITVSALVIASLGSAYIAAGVFGLIATMAYFWDGFDKYKMT